MQSDWSPKITMILAFLVACVAGLVFNRMHVPLPWMLGPLAASATISMLGAKLQVPRLARPLGQLIVAAVVGLAFTPAALKSLVDQVYLMIAATVLSVVAGLVGAVAFTRLANMGLVAATLASIPIGPVEATNLASRYGVPSGPVAVAQTFRVAFIVVVLPSTLILLYGDAVNPLILASMSVSLQGGTLLLAGALVGSLLFRMLGFTNAFFLGALTFAAVASTAGLPVSSLPFPIIAFGQILLGISLGAMFSPGMFQNSSGFLWALLVSTVILLVLCALVGFLIAWFAVTPWPGMVLATAPGSVTEMALTAKILGLDVATITAFHIVRVFIMLVLVPLLFGLAARLITVDKRR